MQLHPVWQAPVNDPTMPTEKLSQGILEQISGALSTTELANIAMNPDICQAGYAKIIDIISLEKIPHVHSFNKRFALIWAMLENMALVLWDLEDPLQKVRTQLNMMLVKQIFTHKFPNSPRLTDPQKKLRICLLEHLRRTLPLMEEHFGKEPAQAFREALHMRWERMDDEWGKGAFTQQVKDGLARDINAFYNSSYCKNTGGLEGYAASSHSDFFMLTMNLFDGYDVDWHSFGSMRDCIIDLRLRVRWNASTTPEQRNAGFRELAAIYREQVDIFDQYDKGETFPSPKQEEIIRAYELAMRGFRL